MLCLLILDNLWTVHVGRGSEKERGVVVGLKKKKKKNMVPAGKAGMKKLRRVQTASGCHFKGLMTSSFLPSPFTWV